MKFQLIILILVSFFNCLLQAATVTITTRTGYDQTSKPPREILYITILEDGKPLQNGNILVDPVSTNPANYQAILTSGGKATAVEVESVKATDKPYTSNFLLFPKSKLESGGTYHVSINKDTWRMRDGSNYNGPASSTETKEDANKFNQDYLARSYYFEKSIKLETGDPGGTIAINWNFTTGSDPYNSPLNEGDWHFAFDGKAGFALKDDERFGFSNSLNSEISGFYRTPWPENPNAAFRFFGDTGFEAEITSDQVFDNAEVASGLFATMIIGNPITDYLSSHVVFGGGLTAALSPIIKLKYQGVATIADNQDRAVDVGNQRLTVGVYWSWPLARDREWFSPFGIETHYNLDLVSDMEVVYDPDKDVWTNNSSNSLELSPAPGSEKNLPIFTLSYIRGEVKPTFENFDALLGGIKFKF